jgi:hypothetical protein
MVSRKAPHGSLIEVPQRPLEVIVIFVSRWWRYDHEAHPHTRPTFYQDDGSDYVPDCDYGSDCDGESDCGCYYERLANWYNRECRGDCDDCMDLRDFGQELFKDLVKLAAQRVSAGAAPDHVALRLVGSSTFLCDMLSKKGITSARNKFIAKVAEESSLNKEIVSKQIEFETHKACRGRVGDRTFDMWIKLNYAPRDSEDAARAVPAHR